MNQELYKIIILNKNSLGTNYLWRTLKLYFSINNIGYQAYKDIYNYDLTSIPQDSNVIARSKIDNESFIPDDKLNFFYNTFNYKITIERCFFEQTLGYCTRVYNNHESNIVRVQDAIHSMEPYELPKEFFLKYLNILETNREWVKNNFQDLKLIEYDDLSFNIDEVIQNMFTFNTTFIDKFGISLSDFSKNRMLGITSDMVKVSEYVSYFNTINYFLSSQNNSLNLTIKKFTLRQKIDAILNFDEILEIYQEKAQDSDTLNNITLDHLLNRCDEEDTYFSV
jgi:hypothetical protein